MFQFLLIVDEHGFAAGGDIERVGGFDVEVIRVSRMDRGPVEAFDRHDVTISRQEPVAGVEVLAFLPLLIRSVPVLVVFSRHDVAAGQPEGEQLVGVRHRRYDFTTAGLTGLRVGGQHHVAFLHVGDLFGFAVGQSIAAFRRTPPPKRPGRRVDGHPAMVLLCASATRAGRTRAQAAYL